MHQVKRGERFELRRLSRNDDAFGISREVHQDAQLLQVCHAEEGFGQRGDSGEILAGKQKLN